MTVVNSFKPPFPETFVVIVNIKQMYKNYEEGILLPVRLGRPTIKTKKGKNNPGKLMDLVSVGTVLQIQLLSSGYILWHKNDIEKTQIYTFMNGDTMLASDINCITVRQV